MGHFIKDKLKAYKEECSKDLEYTRNNFVFFNGTEKPVSYNAIYSAKEKYVELAGVKKITIHGLRYSRASYLIRHSNPGQIVAVARMLGHSVNECLSTYSHFYSEDMQQILDRGDNSMPQELVLTQLEIDKSKKQNIKVERQMVGFTNEEEKSKFGLRSRIIPEDEYTDEDREALKELENFDPDEIEYLSEDKLLAFLNATENGEEDTDEDIETLKAFEDLDPDELDDLFTFLDETDNDED